MLTLRNVKTELSNYLDYSDDYLRTQVTELIKTLDSDIKEADKTIDTSRATSVLEGYRTEYEMLVKEYRNIKATKSTTLTRLRKIQEIIPLVDLIVYYLNWVITRCSNTVGGASKSFVLEQLRTEKETFRSSAYEWTAMLNSVNNELKYYISAGETDGN